MTDGSGTSSYSYNPFGELISAENGASETVSYSHDALGDTTAVTYPLGAGATWANTDTVTYGYDAASELTSVTDFNGNTSVLSNTADGLPSALSLGSSGDTVSTSYGRTTPRRRSPSRTARPSRSSPTRRPLGSHRR